MNQTIKEATVKCFHYESHDQLRTHLTDLGAFYNFSCLLKGWAASRHYNNGRHACRPKNEFEMVAIPRFGLPARVRYTIQLG